jgi:hypothetical protein
MNDNLLEELKAEQLKLEGAWNALENLIKRHTPSPTSQQPPTATPEPTGYTNGEVPVTVEGETSGDTQAG